VGIELALGEVPGTPDVDRSAVAAAHADQLGARRQEEGVDAGRGVRIKTLDVRRVAHQPLQQLLGIHQRDGTAQGGRP
jgi:hypothetical protein